MVGIVEELSDLQERLRVNFLTENCSIILIIHNMNTPFPCPTFAPQSPHTSHSVLELICKEEGLGQNAVERELGEKDKLQNEIRFI